MKPADISGQRFGRLTVVKFDGARRDVGGASRRFWRCQCDCGNHVSVMVQQLRSGNTTSCGCFHKEFVSELFTTHGRSKTRVYRAWQSMRKRCEDPSDKAYKYYGGRGIAVCERWSTFENFFADMGEPPPGLTLERDDNEKGYGPDNCRWATWQVQFRNRRVRADSSTGVRGVEPCGSRFRAVITVDGEAKHLGVFPTIAEATAVRKAAEAKYWRGNCEST